MLNKMKKITLMGVKGSLILTARISDNIPKDFLVSKSLEIFGQGS